MSYKRTAREAARQRVDAETRRRLADAALMPATFVGPVGGGSEMWRRGKITFVLPQLRDGMSPELAEAVVRRRVAALDGVCPCGARLRVQHGRAVVRHLGDCPAQDAIIESLYDGAMPASS